MQNKFFFGVLSAFLLVSLHASALLRSEPISGHFGVPQAARAEMPRSFRLFDWNIHKGSDFSLPADFQQIARDSQVVLFQEFVDHEQLKANIAEAQPTLSWVMARTFFSERESDYHGYTGVATGSEVQSLRENVLISKVTEPIANTPKSAIVTEYKIEGSIQTLMVANIHAINFVTESTFEQHMNQVIEAVRSHQGPMIIAGDFNTWTSTRLKFLNREFAKLGLQHVEVADAYFKISFVAPFDHVFVRGLHVRSAQSLNGISTSDHKPIVVDLDIQENDLSQLGNIL